MNVQDRIIRNPKVVGGEPVSSLAVGAITAEILADFPTTLSEADVRAAIAFAAASAQEDLPLMDESKCMRKQSWTSPYAVATNHGRKSAAVCCERSSR